jgi:ribosome-binding protein aMBF1 (putative translation factor)
VSKSRKIPFQRRGISKESTYFREFEKFAERVRQRIISLRSEKGLTQEGMQEYELNLRQVQRIESGETKNLTLSYIFRLAKAFGIKPSELIDT